MRCFQKMLIGAFAIVLSTSVATADILECIDYGAKAHWTGVTPISAEPYPGDGEYGRLTVNGDVLYVTGSWTSNWAARIFVIDASNPAAPAVVDSLDIYSADFVMKDGYLYMASSGEGVNIVSLADPRHPALVGHLDVGFGPLCIRVRGNLAYVSYDGITGVAVDISDPSHPVPVGPFDIPWGIWSLSFAGDFGYVSVSGQVAVLEFTDPLRPTLLGMVQIPEAVTGMTTIGSLGAAFGGTTLHLFDLTDPTRPRPVSSLTVRDSWYEQRVDVADNLLLWTCPYGAEIWDISDLEQPTNLGWIPALDGAADFGIGPDRIYTVDSNGSARARVAVMDFSSRELVTQDTLLRPFGVESIDSFDVADQRMVTGTGSAFSVYDLADPAQPVRRGTLTLAAGAGVLDANEDMVAIRSASSIRLVDISNPDLPILRGSLPTNGFVRLNGNLAYSAGRDSRGEVVLAVFDLADPDNPVPVGGMMPTESGFDLIIAGNLAISSTGWEVTIFDITNPTSPRPLGEIIHGFGIGLHGDHLYVGTFPGGYKVYDISDPSAPDLIASQVTLGPTTGFAFDGDFVYVNDCFSGCQILDVSDLNAPSWVGGFLIPGVQNLQISQGMVYFGALAAPVQCGGVSSVRGRPRPAASLAADVHPNPFNPAATVTFELAEARTVRLAVHDLTGRRIATMAESAFEAGRHELRWDGRMDDGRTAPSGVYFFRLDAADESRVLKAALIK